MILAGAIPSSPPPLPAAVFSIPHCPSACLIVRAPHFSCTSLGTSALPQDYQRKIRDLEATIEKMQPNMKAVDRFEEVEQRVNAGQDDLQLAKDASREAGEKYTDIRLRRYDIFMGMYKHVAKVLDHIYKVTRCWPIDPLNQSPYSSVNPTKHVAKVLDHIYKVACCGHAV